MGQVGNPGQAGGMVPTERWSTAKGVLGWRMKGGTRGLTKCCEAHLVPVKPWVDLIQPQW